MAEDLLHLRQASLEANFQVPEEPHFRVDVLSLKIENLCLPGVGGTRL